ATVTPVPTSPERSRTTSCWARWSPAGGRPARSPRPRWPWPAGCWRSGCSHPGVAARAARTAVAERRTPLLPAAPPGAHPADPARGGVLVATALTPARLDVAAPPGAVLLPEAGAVGLFTGIVRKHHVGERVAQLEDEAWEGRAAAELAAIAEDVAAGHAAVRA